MEKVIDCDRPENALAPNINTARLKTGITQTM